MESTKFDYSTKNIPLPSESDYIRICVCICIGMCIQYLTIIPRARMGSESIAHEADRRMGY